MTRACLLVLAVLAAPPLAADTIYKWVDEEGRTHYSQEKPAGNRARPVDLRPNLIPGLSAEERRQAKELEAKKAAVKKAAAKAPPQTAPAPSARQAVDAAATAECGTNAAADCRMVDAPAGASTPLDEPLERLGAPGAKPATPGSP